jgi:YHS domain-containing protein
MRVVIAACCVVAALLAGCATGPDQRSAAASTQPHAECLVCKANADLACIDVPVDGGTPSYAYNGKTYYFCSNECRKTFAKNPAKYAGR